MVYPGWLDPLRQNDQLLIDLLNRCKADVIDSRTTLNSENDLLTLKQSDKLQLGQFTAIKDSLYYSQLISAALKHAASDMTLVDLGTGSALPLIGALARAGHSIRCTGVEIDDDAAELARQNVCFAGLQEQVEIRAVGMDDFLSTLDRHQSARLITTNPPYVPWPRNATVISSVSGGPLGTDYLERVLRAAIPAGSIIAIQWSSITAIRNLLDFIRFGHEIIQLSAHEVNLGRYTAKDPVRSYLRELKSQNQISFNDEDGSPSQIIFGAVLRRIR